MAGATVIGIKGDGFTINGQPTYAGKRWRAHKIEGLLLNSRATPSSTTESLDRRRLGLCRRAVGCRAQHKEFVAQLPTYRAHGLLAVSVNLQGGSRRL